MAKPAAGSAFLYLDASTAGISGNMIVGAALDALAPRERDRAAARLARVFARRNFKLESGEVRRHGFRGFYIDGPELDLKMSSLVPEVRRASRALALDAPSAAYAQSVVDLLVTLEARVHGVPRSKVHLHELASLDTVFDAVAGAWALRALGAPPGTAVFARPVEVGSGTVTFSHGTTPIPAPVSQLILHRFRIPFSQHAGREVATPTGLAMLALLRPTFAAPPPSVMVAHGAGAGRLDLPDRPNLLNLQLRERLESSPAFPVHDPVAQIDVSLDDVTGEEAGLALSTALEEGALDAHLVHTMAKKGRPGFVLSVLAREEDGERLADLVGRLTGSWGVRISHRVVRFKKVPRQAKARLVLGPARQAHVVRVKYTEGPGPSARAKAEHEDVAAASRATGEPPRTIARRAEAAVLDRPKPGRRPR